VRAREGGAIWGLRLSRAVAELFGLWLQCWCMGEKGKGARAGLDAMRKSREGVWLGGGGCQVEEQGGRGRGGRQRPDATEAGADRATHEQGRRGVWSVGPHLDERGGVWAAPGTRGPIEEKENDPGPKKYCNFLLNQK
jgi:hypothetical protein